MTFKLTAAFSLTVLAAVAAHAESRELDAHQHGHGTLNIAVEGATVAMELEAPGADIVGFEHPAETAEDRALIDAAIAQLAKPLELFTIPEAAGCTVTTANVALIGEENHEDAHDHGDAHGHEDAHDHDEAHGDEHADHAEDAHGDEHADHAHGDEHAHHADEAKGESHTEFRAQYALTCADPTAIESIEFAYFGLFPNALELDIQMISDKGAKGFEVERDEPRLSLSGAI
ncbi:MAG: DUF2796 domain-containing protein [Pseudomonadota bacterium]